MSGFDEPRCRSYPQRSPVEAGSAHPRNDPMRAREARYMPRLLKPRLAQTALAATFLTAVSTQAFAADLVIWWNKSYYPEEDRQFDKTVAAFEKETGPDVEYVCYTNEHVPRKVLAPMAAGEPPDLSY